MIPKHAPKQIVEYIPCNNPDNQPCFVYEWYNITKDKYYVGYHKGEPFDGYFHSSKDKDFADDFHTCQWRYTIKDFGSDSLMLSLENQILSKANAKDNPKYYNKTNGIPQEFTMPDEELVFDFADQILNSKSLDEIEPVLKSKEDLSNYVEYQARAESLDAEHEKDIKNRIDDSNGAYAQNELLLTVLKDRLWEGKICDLQINGRHSKNAFLKSKTGSYIKVLEIPEEKHRHLSTEEVKLLAIALNPTTKTPRKETQSEDIVKIILDYRLKGLTNKSQTIQSILDRFNLTTYKRRKILNEVNAINYKASTFYGELAGKLKIAIVSTAKYVMPYFLTDFINQNKSVDISIDVTNKNEVVRSLENNEIDFALVSTLPKHLKINSIPLMDNNLFLIGGRQHKLSGKYLSHKEIEQLQLIYREQGSATRGIMEYFIASNKISTYKKMELKSNEALKQAVIAGLGYSIMPLIGIKNELKNGDLQIIPVKNLPMKTVWNLIWLNSKNLSPAAKGFIENIKEHKNNIMKNHFNWFEEYL